MTVDQGLSATKERILDQITKHDLIHLTCHGYFDDRVALNSGLLVSDGNERPPRNPRNVSLFGRNRFLVTARNLLRTRMRTRLIALRACSTGLQAERNSGDEFEGLSRSLLELIMTTNITTKLEQLSDQTVLLILSHLSEDLRDELPDDSAMLQTGNGPGRL